MSLPNPEPAAFRLFIALLLPEPVKDALAATQAELRRQLRADARWARREQLHLTLKFLGDVDPERVPSLTDALRTVCQGFPPLQLRARQIGFFPNTRVPRVVWAGVEDLQQRLLPLQAALQQASLPFTSDAPENDFVGHLTLARLRNLSPTDSRALTTAGAAMAARDFGDWTASSVSLMRSILSPDGAKHYELVQLSLSQTPPPGI